MLIQMNVVEWGEYEGVSGYTEIREVIIESLVFDKILALYGLKDEAKKLLSKLSVSEMRKEKARAVIEFLEMMMLIDDGFYLLLSKGGAVISFKQMHKPQEL